MSRKEKSWTKATKKNEIKILIAEPWQSFLMKRETGRQANNFP